MIHSFDTNDAEKYGVNAAVILHNIRHWIKHNHANGIHCHDGVTYTYNSVKAFREIFPYLSTSMIKTALKKLTEAGELKQGNFNKSAYDRTIWYGIDNAVIDNDFSICQKSQMESLETANQLAENRQPIPDITTDITTDITHIGEAMPDKPATATQIAWKSYAKAYHDRYGVDPIRNQQVNSQFKRFVERVGAEEAPAIAAYFVGSNERWHVKKGHAVGTLLNDAEAIRMQWATSTRITSSAATQADKTQSNAQAAEEVRRMRANR